MKAIYGINLHRNDTATLRRYFIYDWLIDFEKELVLLCYDWQRRSGVSSVAVAAMFRIVIGTRPTHSSCGCCTKNTISIS